MAYERSQLLSSWEGIGRKDGIVHRGADKRRVYSLSAILVTILIVFTAALTFQGNSPSHENELVSNFHESFAYEKSYRSMLLSTTAHRLEKSLRYISLSDNLLFGHQFDTVFGQYFTDFTGDQTKSDVLNSTGMYPAVYGFDFSYIINGEYDFKKHVQDARRRGGVITFSWAADNPVTGGDSYNKSGNPVVELLPGGSANEVWVGWLDRICDFLGNNTDVPVVFRLFHEMTGWWFWWGEENCNSTEFITAWKYTVGYIRIKRNISNCLFLYATSRMYAENHTEAMLTEKNMRSRYPGNEYVNAIGFDCYDNLTWFKESLNMSCNVIFSFALEKGRIPVIGETGHRPHHSDCTNCGKWWSEFYTAYSDFDYSLCHHAAYMMTWSNYNPDNYYVPLPGQEQFLRFSKFMKNREIQLGDSTFWTETARMTGYYGTT